MISCHLCQLVSCINHFSFSIFSVDSLHSLPARRATHTDSQIIATAPCCNAIMGRATRRGCRHRRCSRTYGLATQIHSLESSSAAPFSKPPRTKNACQLLWIVFPHLNGFSIFCLASQYASPNTRDVFANTFRGEDSNEWSRVAELELRQYTGSASVPHLRDTSSHPEPRLSTDTWAFQ
jgi:hypothetical protein